MSTTLLPCPFCGGTDLKVRTDDMEGYIAHVECTDCDDMAGPTSEYKYADEWSAIEDASRVWNRRPSSYQSRIAAASAVLFEGDPTDIAERRDRFAEEANEVCQAFGMTREAAHQLVDYTYDRPVGDPAQEIGAAMTTLTSLANEAGHDISACAEADLAKLVQPETIARIRAKRATRHGRGPLPGLSANSTEGARA